MAGDEAASALVGKDIHRPSSACDQDVEHAEAVERLTGERINAKQRHTCKRKPDGDAVAYRTGQHRGEQQRAEELDGYRGCEWHSCNTGVVEAVHAA